MQPRDVVILHDPQTAGLAPHLLRKRAIVIWRCHIGHDQRTEEVDAGWAFLRPYLQDVPAFVFSRRAGPEVFDRVLHAWYDLPHGVRGRVHLAMLPTADVDENAAIVNALQRAATIVVQKSLHEGFGLTVTEAMWKGRPVVASRVGVRIRSSTAKAGSCWTTRGTSMDFDTR